MKIWRGFAIVFLKEHYFAKNALKRSAFSLKSVICFHAIEEFDVFSAVQKTFYVSELIWMLVSLLGNYE